MAAPSAKLWLLDGDSVAQDDLAFFSRRLGSSETRRLVSFVRPVRQRQFILGRILLRVAVADLLGLPVDTIGIIEQPGNAPLLVLPESQHASPNFSLSHRRNWVACLVSNNVPLGLDIELNEAARDINASSELLFHPSERRWLLTLPHAERVSAFYEIWCSREALHKLLCNLGRKADLSFPVASILAQELERLCWRQIISAFPGLTIVAASDRRFAIRETILKRATRADWIAASQHPHSN
jgi:4'-phosphopantetheinyl transferase